MRSQETFVTAGEVQLLRNGVEWLKPVASDLSPVWSFFLDPAREVCIVLSHPNRKKRG